MAYVALPRVIGDARRLYDPLQEGGVGQLRAAGVLQHAHAPAKVLRARPRRAVADVLAVQLMARRFAAVDGTIDRTAVVAALQGHDAFELVRHRVCGQLLRSFPE